MIVLAREVASIDTGHRYRCLAHTSLTGILPAMNRELYSHDFVLLSTILRRRFLFLNPPKPLYIYISTITTRTQLKPETPLLVFVSAEKQVPRRTVPSPSLGSVSRSRTSSCSHANSEQWKGQNKEQGCRRQRLCTAYTPGRNWNLVPDCPVHC